MVEIWKDIAGYEGLYKVSNQGRVKSFKGAYPRVLKYGYTVQGRRQATLSKEGVAKKFQVHRLVIETFTGPCPPGMECRHLDGNHLNNHSGNLVWGTHAENMHDMVVHGTSLKGQKGHNTKLTEQVVQIIRSSGQSQRTLAKIYGVSQVAIHAIKQNKTWQNVASQHQPAFSSQ